MVAGPNQAHPLQVTHTDASSGPGTHWPWRTILNLWPQEAPSLVRGTTHTGMDRVQGKVCIEKHKAGEQRRIRQ